MTGVALLPQELDDGLLAVEIAWGADLTADADTWTWTDITTDVLFTGPVTITVGRADESSQAQPASCNFTLDNTSGDYTAHNPLSANWPNVRRNTPVRVRVSLDGGSTWKTRFQGYANGFVPGWDLTGNVATVTLSASGKLRRLNQGSTPLRSVVERVLSSASTIAHVAAYWPGEDGTDATQLASGLPGGSPMKVDGSGGTFAKYEGFTGSAPLFELGDNTTIRGTASGGVDTTGQIHFRALLHTPAGITDSTPIVSIRTSGGTATRWDLIYGTVAGGSLTVKGYDASGTVVADAGAFTAFEVDDKAYILSFDLTQSGSDVDWAVDINYLKDDGLTGNFIDSGTFTSVTLGSFDEVVIGNGGMGGCAVGHIGVANVSTWGISATNLLTGYVGETPLARAQRLGEEEGVTVDQVGFYDATMRMGPQTPDTFLNLLREAETTGADFLYDGLSANLSWSGIAHRYDVATKLTVDFSAGGISAFGPVDDDQRNRNKVTVSRKDGSFAIFEDTDGDLGTDTIGVYDTSVTVNTDDDTSLDNRARWEVHAGTIAGYRYPTLGLDFRAKPSLAADWLTVNPADRIDVTNVDDVVTQHPTGTVGLIVEGWTETISPIVWTAVCNCTPARTYDVWKVGDPLLGRLGAPADTTLAQAAAKNATTIRVTNTSLIPFPTTAAYPDDFPLYLDIDGIKVKVTGATDPDIPQTLSVDSATVTKALASGTPVKLWGNGVIKL